MNLAPGGNDWLQENFETVECTQNDRESTHSDQAGGGGARSGVVGDPCPGRMEQP